MGVAAAVTVATHRLDLAAAAAANIAASGISRRLLGHISHTPLARAARLAQPITAMAVMAATALSTLRLWSPKAVSEEHQPPRAPEALAVRALMPISTAALAARSTTILLGAVPVVQADRMVRAAPEVQEILHRASMERAAAVGRAAARMVLVRQAMDSPAVRAARTSRPLRLVVPAASVAGH